MEKAEELQKLYSHRFQDSDKEAIWRVLCKEFFQPFMPVPSNQLAVADFACGYCEFINNISAKTKYAVDLNADGAKYANKEVTFFNCTIAKFTEKIPAESIDCVFISNFLEHLSGKDEIVDVLNCAGKILRKGGRILILQPNIKYVGGAYWDFFDHKIPLTAESLIEASGLVHSANLNLLHCLKKFLPYTTKSSMPQAPWMVWLYLKTLPISGYFFGKQSFLVFEKN